MPSLAPRVSANSLIRPSTFFWSAVCGIGLNSPFEMHWVGIGDWNDTFLKVVHKHKASGRPKKPSLRWTKDGKAIILRFLRERLLLIDLDGESIGRLPKKANEWPRETSIAVSPATIKWRQEARKNVNIAVKAHGGIFIQ